MHPWLRGRPDDEYSIQQVSTGPMKGLWEACARGVGSVWINREKRAMRKFLSLMVAAGICVVFALAFAASPTHAKNVNCDHGQTIQDAVNAQGEGGRIDVFGTCTETVRVRRDDVRIAGREGAILIGAFRVTGRMVRIQGFTIQGNGGSGTGVRISDGGSATVRDNILEDVGNTGITVDDGAYGDIRDNVVSSTGFSGIFVANGGSADIRGNIVTSPNGTGIGIAGNSSAEVRGNTVFDSRFGGISVSESSYVFLSLPNTLENNGSGVSCGTFSVVRVDAAQIFIANGADVSLGSCEVINFSGGSFP